MICSRRQHLLLIPKKQRCQKVRSKLAFLVLLLMIFAASTAGCLRGKTDTVIVLASIAEFPEELNGSPIIMTDEPIMIGIAGTDHLDEKNLAGRIPITQEELMFFIGLIEENRELKKKLDER